jgi:hypothetical protein
MQNVVTFTKPNVEFLLGQPITTPGNRREYLNLLKRFLTESDYADVLCGIMDDEIYCELEDQLVDIIDSYYSFPH